MRGLVWLAAAVSVAAMTAPACATPLLFSLSGPDTASFVLDSQPANVDANIPNGSFITYGSATLNGAPYDSVGFYFARANYSNNTIFEIETPIASQSLRFADTNGQTSFDLFTGPASSPTFRTGTFSFLNYSTGQAGYTLTIADAPDAPAAVPEPSSWALMIGGFGMIGTALRRTRRWAASFA